MSTSRSQTAAAVQRLIGAPGGSPGLLGLLHNHARYDGVNRLTGASESGGASEWTQNFGYDQFGNRSLLTSSTFNPYTGLTPQSGTAGAGPFTGSNQWTGAGYDGVGNQTSVLGTAGDSTLYDTENRLATVIEPNVSVIQYSYDGDGKRVMKVICPTGTSSCTPPGMGDRGSCYATESYPSGSPDILDTKFTSKERDAETGLDYFDARYFSAAQGRFTSPDPKQFPHDISDPQSWNKYGYTRNNPLRYTDPDGDDWKDALAGAFNAFGSDNLFGAGRATGGSSDFRTGQAIGDAVATVPGTVETLTGIGGEVGGTLLDLTGVGALIGVPAQVVSAGAIVLGSSAAVFGAKNLGNAALSSMQDNAPTSSGGKSKPEPRIPRRRTRKGMSPSLTRMNQ